MIGCVKVIGIDRVKSRLELAKTLGVSDCIDTSSSDLDIVAEVRQLTGGDGATIVIDTTGVPVLLEAGLQFTASRGKMVILGVAPPEYSLSIHASTHMRVSLMFLPCRKFPLPLVHLTWEKEGVADAQMFYPQTGKILMGSLEGDSFPEKVCMGMKRGGNFPP